MKLVALFICAACLLALSSVAEGKPPEIKIHGNWVLIDEVYLAVLDLPSTAKANPATAALVERRLHDFLYRAGYVLADVKAKVVDGVIEVHVDEGRLEKIIFLGVGTLKTLRLKLDLTLPHHVFNRPNLIRQLKYLGNRHGVSKITFKLVPVRHVEHEGPQVGDFGKIKGHAVLLPDARYQLHIRFGQSDWGTGFGLDLEYDFPDGLTLGGNYKGEGLLFADDRWRVGAKAGGKVRSGLDDGEPYLALSRAATGFRWYTPALVGRGLRPYIWLRSDLETRQRGDLDVEIYYSERLEGSLNIGYEFVDALAFSIGGGVEERFIFGVEYKEDTTPPMDEKSRFRPFILGKADMSFGSREVRRDRGHHLALEGRHYWVEGLHSFGKIVYSYRSVFEIGWHDLWIKSRGTWMWGEILFYDEEPVGGRYIRGVFGDRYYVHRVGNLVLEFRLSLYRDVVKLGIFHDLALFGELDRVNGGEDLRVADSFGLGFHLLIMDSFQLDFYYGFGFSFHDEGFDHGLAVSLKKVY